MADSSAARLPLLARLLPRPFRERVVEPAYADLQIDRMRSTDSALRWAAARILFILECIRLGLPAWLWWRGRPTRFSRGLAAGLALVALLFWVVAKRVGYGY